MRHRGNGQTRLRCWQRSRVAETARRKDAPIGCGENRVGHSVFHCRKKGRNHLSKDQARLQRKQHLDALLLALPGVIGKTINGLDAYFVTDRMFACISGTGVGMRLPIAKATELQFSRDNVVPFQPGGMASTREWVQIDRADATDYKNDLELFQASMEFVRGGSSR